MRTLERILLIVAFAGFLMRTLLIPGGSEVLLIGFTFAALFYWLLSFAALNRIPLGGLFKKVSYANIGALVPTRSWISLFHHDDPTYRDIFIRSVENPKDREALEELENYRSNSIK